MYSYVCMYVCMYVFMNVYKYYVCTRMYVCIYVCMCVCRYVCMYVNVWMYTYVCMHVMNLIPCLFLTDLWNRIQKYRADVTSRRQTLHTGWYSYIGGYRQKLILGRMVTDRETFLCTQIAQQIEAPVKMLLGRQESCSICSLLAQHNCRQKFSSTDTA